MCLLYFPDALKKSKKSGKEEKHVNIEEGEDRALAQWSYVPHCSQYRLIHEKNTLLAGVPAHPRQCGGHFQFFPVNFYANMSFS